MKLRRLASYGRIFFGSLTLFALSVQFAHGVHQGWSTANFFSFFTVQSNIVAAIILIIVGFGTLLSVKSTRQFAFLRGAATLYMTMTGVITFLLLADVASESLQTTLPWVDTVVHTIMPIVVLADWLLFPPKFKFSFRTTAYWLLFPLFYLAYSLVRGALTGWYPYPFIDPNANGWSLLITTCIGIALSVAVFAWLLALRTKGAKHGAHQ